MSLHIVKSALSSPDETTWDDLREETPEIEWVVAMVGAKLAAGWLIYGAITLETTKSV